MRDGNQTPGYDLRDIHGQRPKPCSARAGMVFMTGRCVGRATIR